MNVHLLNWYAVGVAALIYMSIGMVWYGPLFGKYWMKLLGLTPESMRTMPLSPLQAIVGGSVAAVCMAAVLSYASLYFAAVTVVHALILAFWMWFGFVVPTQAGSYLWEGKPFMLLVLNASFYLVTLSIMSVILVLWR